MRESVGLPPVPALLVRSVEDDGPSGTAGIRAGDLMVRGGTHELRSIAALYAAINDAAETRRLKLILLRGADEHHLTVKLGDRSTPDGTLAATTAGTTRNNHTI